MAMKRTFVIEPQLGEDGEVVQNRAKAEQILLDLLGFLWSSGGSVRIVSDRVKMGVLPGPDREPLAETVGMVIEFDARVPLHEESLTQALLDHAFGSDEAPAAAPAAAAEPVAASLTKALSEPGDDEGEDEDGGGDDNGDDGSGVPGQGDEED